MITTSRYILFTINLIEALMYFVDLCKIDMIYWYSEYNQHCLSVTQFRSFILNTKIMMHKTKYTISINNRDI